MKQVLRSNDVRVLDAQTFSRLRQSEQTRQPSTTPD
jgi:hypothetical protein